MSFPREQARDLRFPEVATTDGWALRRTGPLLLVTFQGFMRAPDGPASVQRAVELMGDDTVHIVADLLALRDYDSEVRVAWQLGLQRRADQLASVLVGARSSLVKMGVTAFGLFIGVPVTIAASRAELSRRATSSAANG